MKTVGIICEYNPLHRGHALHIESARLKSGADYVLCAMSGACMQRGGLASFDKWTRARMALLCGADAVFELPALFVCRAAPDYALGGVSLLNRMGADCISFGSEIADIGILRSLSRQAGADDALIKRELAKGVSYPRALQAAYDAGGAPAGLSTSPNVILALEYIRALKKTSSQMRPLVVFRDRDDGLSASLLRERLFAGDPAALDMMPENCAALLSGKGPVDFAALWQAVLYKLRSMDAQALSAVAGMDEGLENRFLRAARSATTLEELFFTVKCKRYTLARIRRAALACALDMSKELCARFPAPPYLRLLGMRRSAAPLLRSVSQNSSLPLITKLADAQMNDCLALDIRAQDLWSLAAGERPGADFTTSPIII